MSYVCIFDLHHVDLDYRVTATVVLIRFDDYTSTLQYLWDLFSNIL